MDARHTVTPALAAYSCDQATTPRGVAARSSGYSFFAPVTAFAFAS